MKMTSDVVVIGGGLVGCATAYYLSKENKSVTLVERGQINRPGFRSKRWEFAFSIRASSNPSLARA